MLGSPQESLAGGPSTTRHCQPRSPIGLPEHAETVGAQEHAPTAHVTGYPPMTTTSAATNCLGEHDGEEVWPGSSHGVGGPSHKPVLHCPLSSPRIIRRAGLRGRRPPAAAREAVRPQAQSSRERDLHRSPIRIPRSRTGSSRSPRSCARDVRPWRASPANARGASR